jgi:2-dehydro-3-deoxygluconokinase
VRVATELGLTVSCDMNYRKKLWKWGKAPDQVMPELVGYCDVIIGNEEAADKMLGVTTPDSDATSVEIEADKYRYICEEMGRRFSNLRAIAITLRGSISASHNTWSGVLWTRGGFYEAHTYGITHIVDRVGGGDAFCAGLIYGLRTYGEDWQKVLDFAVATSCLKHSIFGDFNLVTIAEVEKLMGGDVAGRVSR